MNTHSKHHSLTKKILRRFDVPLSQKSFSDTNPITESAMGGINNDFGGRKKDKIGANCHTKTHMSQIATASVSPDLPSANEPMIPTSPQQPYVPLSQQTYTDLEEEPPQPGLLAPTQYHEEKCPECWNTNVVEGPLFSFSSSLNTIPFNLHLIRVSCLF